MIFVAVGDGEVRLQQRDQVDFGAPLIGGEAGCVSGLC